MYLRKKAHCFLVCYHANIILLAFVFEEFFFFIEVQLIYNAVLVSGVQQSDSVIPMFIFFKVVFHYGLLNIVPWATIQQVPVFVLFF